MHLKRYFILLMFTVSTILWADGPKKPFREIELGTEHRFITTGAKLTSGLIQTTAGALHLLWFPILHGSFDSNKAWAIEGVNPKGKTYNLKVATRGEQLNIILNLDY